MTNHSFTCPLIRIIIASSDRNNPNRSIPTSTIFYGRVHHTMFQSYQSKQINPDMFGLDIQGIETELFQSYQSKQINPDARFKKHDTTLHRRVSIVSIQTDQSRQYINLSLHIHGVMFQSYQSKQINPDAIMAKSTYIRVFSFQSYQSKQINPDNMSHLQK